MQIIENSLAQHFLGILRDRNTSSSEFNYALERISEVLAVHILHDYPTVERQVETPIESTTINAIDSSKVILLPIMRAGFGLLAGFRQYLPEAQIAFIAQKRDESTAEAEQLYDSLPEDANRKFIFVLDPMLATGGSLANTIQYLLDKGCQQKQIIVATVISSPEGVEFVEEKFPDLNLFTISVDREMNQQKYIVPGLGDAGDRQFNT